MNSNLFIEQWLEYSIKYDAWFAPVKKFQDEYIKEHDLTWADYEQINSAVQNFQEEHRSNNDLPAKIYTFFDRHYRIYMEATAAEREEIRTVPELNRDFYQIVWGYISRAKRNLIETGVEEWLTRGVVMISIENMATDFRDTLLSLASLYVEAEKLGLTPQPVLNEVSNISSNEKPRGGNTPMAETLRNFSSSAVVKEGV